MAVGVRRKAGTSEGKLLAATDHPNDTMA